MNKKTFLLLFSVGATTIVLIWVALGPQIQTKIDPTSCPIVEKKEVVRGNSLAPLIKDGEEIVIWQSYYRCHEVERNDLIIYSYPGNPDPLIKIVRGIPGDIFYLEPREINKKEWFIVMNKKRLVNSEGKTYIIGEKNYRVLNLYARDYKNTIPPNAYFITGNIVSGTLDSTVFGLVAKEDLAGKALIK